MPSLKMVSHERIGKRIYGPQDYKVRFAIKERIFPYNRGSVEITVRIQVHGNQIHDLNESRVAAAAFKELMSCKLEE